MKYIIGILLLMLVGVVYWYMQRPDIIYTCRVYRIYGGCDTIVYKGKFAPAPPRWSRHYGWSNAFDDETICRYELIKTDTIW